MLYLVKPCLFVIFVYVPKSETRVLPLSENDRSDFYRTRTLAENDNGRGISIGACAIGLISLLPLSLWFSLCLRKLSNDYVLLRCTSQNAKVVDWRQYSTAEMAALWGFLLVIANSKQCYQLVSNYTCCPCVTIQLHMVIWEGCI